MRKRYTISLSGGLASAASAVIAHEQGYNYEMVFADTLIEHPDLYRFINQLSRALGKPYVHLIDGRDPWDVFVDREYIGNTRTAHCSRDLKTAKVAEWMEANAFHHEPLVLGMYLDEEDRLDRAKANWKPQEVTSLLIDHKITPGKAAEIVSFYVAKRPVLYDMGFPHNNCGGGCVRAGQGQWNHLLNVRPQFYAQLEDRNEWAREQIAAKIQARIDAGTYKGSSGEAGGFIRVVRDGETEYLHLKEFRERVQSGELIPAPYEFGGCGCFVDDAV